MTLAILLYIKYSTWDYTFNTTVRQIDPKQHRKEGMQLGGKKR